MGEGSLRGTLKLEGIVLEREGPIPLIEKQQWTAAANHKKVLTPFVLKVGKQGACSVVQYPHSSLLGDVFHRSVTAVAVEPVGQPGWLADIEIIEAVIVIVAGGHSVVAVNVDTASAVKHRPPIVRS